MIWNVYHQYCPQKLHLLEPDRNGLQVRFYHPAVFLRGQVKALSDLEAILEALRQRLSNAPLVAVA